VTILHISTALTWRGGEQQLANLIKANKGKCDNLVLCAKGSVMQEYCAKNQIKHFTFSTSFVGRYRAGRLINRICRMHSVLLIHCHDSHAHTMAVIASVLGNKIPVVVHRRVDFRIGGSWFSRYKYNHPSIAAYICVSDAIKKIMQSELQSPVKVITIYSGINFSRFQHNKANTNKLKNELGLDNTSILIGNTSALAPHKDYVTFVITAGLLLVNHPDWHFVIMGDGPSRQQIENLIIEKNLVRNITLTGFRTDLPELLGGLDVFLMTSETEGLGTSVLDAFYVGVPVVATRTGGIPELVEDGRTGLLAEPADAKALATKVEKIVADDVLRSNLIANARKKVSEFGYETMAAKVFACYSEILN
jgi:glycosyltransferase involved in cell wall biosynthesis